jgi:rhodanese-related sulfurtransferase
LTRVAEIKTLSPEEASALLSEGYVYVDVRSEPEFEAGHVPGALNVPLLHQGPAGMATNPEFLSVMQQAFGASEKLIVGCKAGGRSRKAAEQLVAAGYQQISDMSAGWEGSRDAFGRAQPGWSKKGLPIETGKPSGQAYSDVKQRAGK